MHAPIGPAGRFGTELALVILDVLAPSGGLSGGRHAGRSHAGNPGSSMHHQWRMQLMFASHYPGNFWPRARKRLRSLMRLSDADLCKSLRINRAHRCPKTQADRSTLGDVARRPRTTQLARSHSDLAIMAGDDLGHHPLAGSSQQPSPFVMPGASQKLPFNRNSRFCPSGPPAVTLPPD
jgi:hypothetical protein